MGAARPLQGSGGRRDSSERERERRSLGFSPMAPLGGRAAEMTTQQRWSVVLRYRWGDGSGREEERLEPRWVRWIMGVLSLRLL
jgi:hypothetical protein